MIGEIPTEKSARLRTITFRHTYLIAIKFVILSRHSLRVSYSRYHDPQDNIRHVHARQIRSPTKSTLLQHDQRRETEENVQCSSEPILQTRW